MQLPGCSYRLKLISKLKDNTFPVMRTIDVIRLDFTCQTPVQVIDINTAFLRNYPDASLDRLADFPDSMTCNP